jgi:hypothetical protein
MSPGGSKLIMVNSALRAAAVHLRSPVLPADGAKAGTALFSAYGGGKQTLPDLSYDYGALQRTYLLYDLDMDEEQPYGVIPNTQKL